MQTDRLSIVSGKGGVGKSVVAASLALAEASQGRRTLLAEINGSNRLAHLFGVPALGSTIREIADNLWLVDVNPADSIREYILMTLKFEALYKALFENRVIGSLLRLMPALGQLTMLGKLWYHAGEKGPLGPRFESMVIDAPATGHMRAMAEAPRKVAASVPPGPMRQTADRLDAWLVDKAQTRLFNVTLAETMPIQETQELIAMAEALGMPLGPVVVNGLVQPLPEDVLAAGRAASLDPNLRACLEGRAAAAKRAAVALTHLPAAALAPVLLPRITLPPEAHELSLAQQFAPMLVSSIQAAFAMGRT